MQLYCAGPMSAVSFCRADDAGSCRRRPPWVDRGCRVHGPDAPVPWDFNYGAFQQAVTELDAAGFAVQSPHAEGQVAGWGWGDYMRRGLAQMLTCDGVATLDGWQLSRGATIEVDLARQLGMPVQPVEDWLGDGQPVSRES